MKQTVNTGAGVKLNLTHSGRTGGTLFLQNLGSGSVYVDTDPAVDATTGLKIATGVTLGPLDFDLQSLYVMASADGQDLRILLAGG